MSAPVSLRWTYQFYLRGLWPTKKIMIFVYLLTSQLTVSNLRVGHIENFLLPESLHFLFTYFLFKLNCSFVKQTDTIWGRLLLGSTFVWMLKQFPYRSHWNKFFCLKLKVACKFQNDTFFILSNIKIAYGIPLCTYTPSL